MAENEYAREHNQVDYAAKECTPDEVRVLGDEDAQKLAVARVRHRLDRYPLEKERGWLLDLARRLVGRLAAAAPLPPPA